MLLLHYRVKCRSRSLAIDNNEFLPGSVCVGSEIIKWIATNVIDNYYQSISHIKQSSSMPNSPGGRWTCWGGRLIRLSGQYDWLLWWQQRRNPSPDRTGTNLHATAGKKNLEIRHQTGYENPSLSDLHCASHVVWVWNVDHYEILVRPPGCVWYVGIMQDSEDPIHPPHNQWWSPVPLELSAALQHSYKQTAPFLRSHRPQLSWRRSPSCHCCRDTQASSGLEKARRETQSHLVTFGGGRPETSEHWSFFCVQKSFWAGGLASHRGQGYALEEYAIKRRRISHITSLSFQHVFKMSSCSTNESSRRWHHLPTARSVTAWLQWPTRHWCIISVCQLTILK